MSVRIIAGERRGHKLESPSDRSTRPTSDKVRESIFNIIAGLVEDRAVYDVFAGSGALGLEALSRGARQAMFVERDRANAAVIRRNIGHLRFEDRTTVILVDGYRWLSTYVSIDRQPVLILIDPPYRDYQTKPSRIMAALNNVVANVPQGSAIVVEAPEKLGSHVLPDLDKWDARRYGNTLVAIRVIEQSEPVGSLHATEARGTEPHA